MRFDHVFDNNSIGTPVRASLLTGEYPQTNGVLDLTGELSPERQYLAAEKVPDSKQRRGFASRLRGLTRPIDWRTVADYRYWMLMADNLRVPAHFGLRTKRYKLNFFNGATPTGDDPPRVGCEFDDLKMDRWRCRTDTSIQSMPALWAT